MKKRPPAAGRRLTRIARRERHGNGRARSGSDLRDVTAAGPLVEALPEVRRLRGPLREEAVVLIGQACPDCPAKTPRLARRGERRDIVLDGTAATVTWRPELLGGVATVDLDGGRRDDATEPSAYRTRGRHTR